MIKKVEIVMHGNLRSFDVAPVFLGFNYETHNIHLNRFCMKLFNTSDMNIIRFCQTPFDYTPTKWTVEILDFSTDPFSVKLGDLLGSTYD